MKTVNINKLPLLDLWYDSDKKKKWKANLPFTPQFPLWSGINSTQTTVVYFEVEAGNELGEHSESSEEILFVLSGNAEVMIGNDRCTITVGDLVVIPPSVPHYIINKGDETAKFLAFFASKDSHSTFSEEVSPVGMKVL
ncbi:cupin domain-containing protein [Alkalihalobacterium alkalinitrilicum]|uniref:cupin domain-containing protein n=1 Tax=Alkalihalobacterium alkalinitrilicum TaxID=427920 RepID=UPI000994C82C|nr:cupin domain-containing protein [Alkalihalobacterium alkalinitrilicum]